MCMYTTRIPNSRLRSNMKMIISAVNSSWRYLNSIATTWENALLWLLWFLCCRALYFLWCLPNWDDSELNRLAACGISVLMQYPSVTQTLLDCFLRMRVESFDNTEEPHMNHRMLLEQQYHPPLWCWIHQQVHRTVYWHCKGTFQGHDWLISQHALALACMNSKTCGNYQSRCVLLNNSTNGLWSISLA